MTEQFDEGVKEIVMTMLSLGATAYEADYILDQLKKTPEPIEQKIAAVKQADDIIKSPKFDQVAAEVINTLEREVKTVVAKGSPQYIIDRLVNGGLTKTAAIGVVANLKAESNLDPGIKQRGGGPGRGLAQWEKGGRYDTDPINLNKFAAKKGTTWSDLDTQIDFILYEMEKHPEYRRVKEQLNNTDSIEQATLIFLKKYEKAGTPHTGKRLKYAKELTTI
jgi:hypothetical protein|tara:strand:+ start:242 stop:904 length:663 start_codon:yes stop_codon:yes gene_type:complete